MILTDFFYPEVNGVEDIFVFWIGQSDFELPVEGKSDVLEKANRKRARNYPAFAVQEPARPPAKAIRGGHRPGIPSGQGRDAPRL